MCLLAVLSVCLIGVQCLTFDRLGSIEQRRCTEKYHQNYWGY